MLFISALWTCISIYNWYYYCFYFFYQNYEFSLDLIEWRRFFFNLCTRRKLHDSLCEDFIVIWLIYYYPMLPNLCVAYLEALRNIILFISCLFESQPLDRQICCFLIVNEQTFHEFSKWKNRLISYKLFLIRKEEKMGGSTQKFTQTCTLEKR